MCRLHSRSSRQGEAYATNYSSHQPRREIEYFRPRVSDWEQRAQAHRQVHKVALLNVSLCLGMVHCVPFNPREERCAYVGVSTRAFQWGRFQGTQIMG